MARRSPWFRAFGWAALAALIAAGSAGTARATVPARPRLLRPSPAVVLEDPVFVDEVLIRRGRPDLYASGRAECLAYLAERPDEPIVTWYVFPRRGDAGRPRALAGLGAEERRIVEAACGPDAARFARLVQATCVEPSALFDLLSAPELLSWRPPPLPPALRWAPVREGVEPEGGPPTIGCARVVEARDGSARLWIPLRERLADPGAASGVGLLRGLAFLQVKGPGGEVRVFRDRAREDLHLDSVVDALEPLPGPGARYLVVGARTFDAAAPGALPRRYAFVVEVDAEGPRLLRGQFVLGKAPRDLLLLQGAEPPGGDLRLHALSARALAWAPRDGTLWLSALGRARLRDEEGGDAGRVLVARYRDGVFRLAAARWSATAEKPGDARVWLAERWGSVEEVGQRAFEEILGTRTVAQGDVRESGAGAVASR
jgi:hypothetical protein